LFNQKKIRMSNEGSEGKILRVADDVLVRQKRLLILALWLLVVAGVVKVAIELLFRIEVPVWVEVSYAVFAYWRVIAAFVERQRVFTRRTCPGCGELGLKLYPYAMKGNNVVHVACKHCSGNFETDLEAPYFSGGIFKRRWE
jgi:hypothetical protein